MPGHHPNAGFTLIEMLLVVAILAIVTSLAMPLYGDHIKQTRLSVAKTNAHSLRLFMEDYYLTNGSYAVGDDLPHTYSKTDLEARFAWRPDGDNGAYAYTVTADTHNWAITVKHTASGNWIRCENRFAKCCDMDTDQATESGCP